MDEEHVIQDGMTRAVPVKGAGVLDGIVLVDGGGEEYTLPLQLIRDAVQQAFDERIARMPAPVPVSVRRVTVDAKDAHWIAVTVEFDLPIMVIGGVLGRR